MAKSTAKFPYLASSFDLTIEEYCATAERFGQQVKQLSKGNFCGTTTTITLPGVLLMLRSAAASHICHCWIPQQPTLLFPLKHDDLYVQGRLAGHDRQIGSLGNHEAHLLLPDNCAHLVVCISEEALAARLSPAEYSRFMETLADIEQGLVDPHSRQLTTDRLLEICRAVEESPLMLPQNVLQDCANAVIDAVYGYLSFQQRQAPVRAVNSEKILHRALALMAAHPTRLFTLDEIARQIYASKRAIQYACASIAGLSPMRLQKLYRMNLIRDEIKSADGQARFRDIVAKYSFTNAGRMSREYTELFGERPRDTMRRFRPESCLPDADDS